MMDEALEERLREKMNSMITEEVLTHSGSIVVRADEDIYFEVDKDDFMTVMIQLKALVLT